MKAYQKKGRPTGEGGFTLLEVIVAISILTFGLLAVASMQLTAIRGNYNASNITGGTTVAQDRLELFLLQPYNTVDEGALPQEIRDGYTIDGTVSRLDASNANNGQIITVTVTWQDKGVPKQSVLTCIKPNV
ncbi:MAG: prepilin-type N-terminal cleavage/methylation domain-containing protein [Thermodesulfobacteriota bacterium]|nr:prepilin-type N-terminal cleavage/methylation domain-containing protein [Thermodesulfobacteriota bacterium]